MSTIAPTYDALTQPTTGEPITMTDGALQVPARPIIPFIEGDGTGPDIWRAAQLVLDHAVAKAYGGDRQIAWFEVYAGEKAKENFDSWLPDDTLRAMEHYRVAIKGPLTTPVGGGFRSLNVTLRQKLDLYACVRPVRWYRGVPSPVKHPELVDRLRGMAEAYLTASPPGQGGTSRVELDDMQLGQLRALGYDIE